MNCHWDLRDERSLKPTLPRTSTVASVSVFTIGESSAQTALGVISDYESSCRTTMLIIQCQVLRRMKCPSSSTKLEVLVGIDHLQYGPQRSKEPYSLNRTLNASRAVLGGRCRAPISFGCLPIAFQMRSATAFICSSRTCSRTSPR